LDFSSILRLDAVGLNKGLLKSIIYIVYSIYIDVLCI